MYLACKRVLDADKLQDSQRARDYVAEMQKWQMLDTRRLDWNRWVELAIEVVIDLPGTTAFLHRITAFANAATLGQWPYLFEECGVHLVFDLGSNEPVAVPEKRTVKFKVGRLMKQRLSDLTGVQVEDEAHDVAEMHEHDEEEENDTADQQEQGA